MSKDQQALINYAVDTMLIGVFGFVLTVYALWFNSYCRVALHQG